VNRMRTTVAVLGAAGALTAAQLGLAGTAAAVGADAQAGKCPIKISTPKRFYVDANGWVTNGGLYFGVKNTSKTKDFSSVSLTISKPVNLKFGYATPTKGSKITKRTTKTVTVFTKKLAATRSSGFRVKTRMGNVNRDYEVRLTLRGKGWDCAVDQGWWGTIDHN
jgi:hypothetical protein